MATTKGSSTPKTKAPADKSKAAQNKSIRTANASRSDEKVTAKRAATSKPGTSKKTNSGGTLRTASHQAESPKSTQAKEASENAGKSNPSKQAAKASVTTKTETSASKTAGKTKSNKKSDGIIATVIDSVTGIFTGGEPDAVDLLKADHRKVEDLFEQVKANEDGNNAAVFKKIKTELDAHTHIEETVFYPYLLDKGKKDLKKITRECIEEHRQAKMFLSELAGVSGASEKFKAKLKVLMEDIEHHVKEEEDEMFKMVRDQFSNEKLRELGARLLAEKEKFTKRQNAKKPARSTPRRKAATAS